MNSSRSIQVVLRTKDKKQYDIPRPKDVLVQREEFIPSQAFLA